MQYKNFQEAVENINWNLLEQQRTTLEQMLVSTLDMKVSGIPDEKLKDLWGLIEFIENLQDVREAEMSCSRN